MNRGKQDSAAARLAEGLRRLVPILNLAHGRTLALAAIALLIVFVLVKLWRSVGPDLRSSEQFTLTEEKLSITEQPEWIDPATNVRAEVFRDGSLSGMNLLDTQAAVQIARAFELHTWVRRVVRVQKQAAGRVVVDLEYRRPVALVEVLFNNILSYEPVDMDGVVLPEDLFRRDESQLRNYLKITADYSMPTGVLGTPWGDQRIEGAARIAALLDKAWRQWNVTRIIAHPPDPISGRCTYEVCGQGNSRILWGHAPGKELSSEPPALRKILWLADYFRQHGPLDADGPEGKQIDLRLATGLEATPRTASR